MLLIGILFAVKLSELYDLMSSVRRCNRFNVRRYIKNQKLELEIRKSVELPYADKIQLVIDITNKCPKLFEQTLIYNHIKYFNVYEQIMQNAFKFNYKVSFSGLYGKGTSLYTHSISDKTICSINSDSEPFLNHVFERFRYIDLNEIDGLLSRYNKCRVTTNYLPSNSLLINNKKVPKMELFKILVKFNYKVTTHTSMRYLWTFDMMINSLEEYIEAIQPYLTIEFFCYPTTPIPSVPSSDLATVFGSYLFLYTADFNEDALRLILQLYSNCKNVNYFPILSFMFNYHVIPYNMFQLLNEYKTYIPLDNINGFFSNYGWGKEIKGINYILKFLLLRGLDLTLKSNQHAIITILASQPKLSKDKSGLLQSAVVKPDYLYDVTVIEPDCACPVCLESIVKSPNVVRTNCHHDYHLNCILPCTVCPLCRTVLKSEK